jgi:hypothetical protein
VGQVYICPIECIHCNECRQKTRHQRLCKTVDTETEDLIGPGSIDWVTTNEAFQCCGCGMTVLRRTVICDIDDWNTVQYFPPGVSRHPPSWRHNRAGIKTCPDGTCRGDDPWQTPRSMWCSKRPHAPAQLQEEPYRAVRTRVRPAQTNFVNCYSCSESCSKRQQSTRRNSSDWSSSALANFPQARFGTSQSMCFP